MRLPVLATPALAAMAGCAVSDPGDPRAQSLLSLPGPQHFAERNVARDLTDRCSGFGYDSAMADALSEARLAAGATAGSTRSSDVDLETEVKQRSLAAYYGQSSFDALDACAPPTEDSGHRTLESRTG
ncbi:hypothetical protein QO034_04600 [Sedimentitalea sp. JM2-8]|uniref:Lipoprotein n=1 Tax=Sedimentitalea xiamensis TaxID=3050037 RepID=A0ABT7FB99_9RHOB|nr:hypothetical protein [Sedimentitalea xiamensis]MDK3072384.1 hypothetical protein [Sedimentitalea xiamensis]